MKTKLFVKKIWSTNPNEYEFLPLDTATDRYSRYVEACIDAKYREWKTFDEWLRTEI